MSETRSHLSCLFPSKGTDVMGMATTAEPSADGSYYTVNGTKMWITNGTVDGTTTGHKFIVYVKTGKGRAAADLSAFIIEKGECVMHVPLASMQGC
jgi:alkylation response protein AidB-like acyl-CoA dehydrogenase